MKIPAQMPSSQRALRCRLKLSDWRDCFKRQILNKELLKRSIQYQAGFFCKLPHCAMQIAFACIDGPTRQLHSEVGCVGLHEDQQICSTSQIDIGFVIYLQDVLPGWAKVLLPSSGIAARKGSGRNQTFAPFLPAPKTPALLWSRGQRGRGARFMSSTGPCISRSMPAQAIIAALSVHSAIGGATKRAPV